MSAPCPVWAALPAAAWRQSGRRRGTAGSGRGPAGRCQGGGPRGSARSRPCRRGQGRAGDCPGPPPEIRSAVPVRPPEGPAAGARPAWRVPRGGEAEDGERGVVDARPEPPPERLGVPAVRRAGETAHAPVPPRLDARAAPPPSAAGPHPERHRRAVGPMMGRPVATAHQHQPTAPVGGHRRAAPRRRSRAAGPGGPAALIDRDLAAALPPAGVGVRDRVGRRLPDLQHEVRGRGASRGARRATAHGLAQRPRRRPGRQHGGTRAAGRRAPRAGRPCRRRTPRARWARRSPGSVPVQRLGEVGDDARVAVRAGRAPPPRRRAARARGAPPGWCPMAAGLGVRATGDAGRLRCARPPPPAGARD